jgi:hypothetical protein
VEGAGASPREDGADWRADHEEVRPAELLALIPLDRAKVSDILMR